jgi:hypothetical protein
LGWDFLYKKKVLLEERITPLSMHGIEKEREGRKTGMYILL